MTRRDHVTLLTLASFMLVLALVSACGVPPRPEPGPSTGTPVNPEPASGILLSEWADIESAIGAPVNPGSVTVQGFELGYDTAGAAVTNLHLQFIVSAGEKTGDTFYAAWRRRGEGRYEYYERAGTSTTRDQPMTLMGLTVFLFPS